MTPITKDRRQVSALSITLNALFAVILVGLVFWVSCLGTRIHTVHTLQESVLASNIKSNKQCNGIKEDLQRIEKQVGQICKILMSVGP